MKIHTGEKPYRCTQCDKAYHRNSALIWHKKKAHTQEKAFKCSQCDKAFHRNYDLSRHKKNVHKLKETFKCSQCEEIFHENNLLKKHIKSHREGISDKCTQCNKFFSNKSNFTAHLRTHSGKKSYHCNQCNKAYTKNSSLVRHMKVHTEVNPLQGKQCGILLFEDNILTNHVITHQKERIYQCSQCSKSFFRKRYLTNHMKLHLGNKPYKCDVCEKTFILNSRLKKHMKIHNVENFHQCSQCEKTFSNKFLFEQHMKCHIGEKPYHCGVCDKYFSQKGLLQHHMRIHTGEKPYKCNQCDKAFSRKTYLNDHIRGHKGEKPYKCNECEKSYSKKGSLKLHIKYHTKEKPYQCSQCDSAFPQKDMLKRHIILHSNDHIIPNKYNECIKPDCGKIFIDHKGLYEHLRYDHDSYLQVSEHTFVSMKDFLSWKEAEETKKYVYYPKHQSSKKGKFATYSYYHCQKNGSSRHHYKKGEPHRKTKRRNKKGVIKTDTFCPSRMICKVDHLTGKASVTYVELHSHAIQYQDTKHHPIPRSLVEKVELRLISGSTPREIFKDLNTENICNSQEDSADNIQQKHISIRSIKKIADKLKSRKDTEYQIQENDQEESSMHVAGISSMENDSGNVIEMNQDTSKDSSNQHGIGTSTSVFDAVKVNENQWNIETCPNVTKENTNKYIVEFIMPYCGDYSCSDVNNEFSSIGLCSHMYICTCQEKHNLCCHIHKVHSLRNHNYQVPNISTTDNVLCNDTYSNDDEQFNSIMDISEENYEENIIEPNNDDTLMNKTLKTIENIQNHLSDDKNRSLYLNHMSNVLEQLNAKIEAIKSNNRITGDGFDKTFTDL